MASGSDDEFVTLLCTNSYPIEHTETLISTTDIHNWDLSAILRCQTVKIKAHRHRLAEQSSFFHGLFSGSFSESNLSCVSIQWNMEVFINVLKCVYGFKVDVTSKTFLSLFEAALYFGAESLLLKCKIWLSEASSTKGPGLHEIQLDDLIHIWNFGLEHANDFVPELCASYLARNFMWAISSKFFGDVPYNLLFRCIKHPDLTVYSEMHLSDALLVWLNANTEKLQPFGKVEDDCTGILKQIRISLLPLWFAAGKRRSCYFTELAEESIDTIFRLLKIPPADSIGVFEDGDLDHLRIRVTEYSKIWIYSISQGYVSLRYINLKGCISVTDTGMSNLIRRCGKLHSILVCDTSFGINSVQALCSSITSFGPSASDFEKRCSDSLAFKLQTLHMGGCKGVNERSLLDLISQTQALISLCLRDTHLVDDALYSFPGSSLETLDVCNTMVSGAALSHVVNGNPALKCLNARGCKNLIHQGSNASGVELSSSYSCRDLYAVLGKKCKLEEIALGWGFSWFSLVALRPAIMSLRAISVGLGGSLGEDALRLLPTTCPMLESIVLCFQVISNAIIINIMRSLRHLQALALCYCLGDISTSSFKNSVTNLRKLRLERVTPQMTDNDLVVLTQNCASLVEFSLVGCRLLTSDSLSLISLGWPGLISIHLEDCGEVTATGVSSLFNCRALEDILLRHNGSGIASSFILDAASKMPMLRQVSLDSCDALEGDFDIPNHGNRYFLSAVKIARCKFKKSPNINFQEAHRRPVHKDTLVLVWNSQILNSTVVKERI